MINNQVQKCLLDFLIDFDEICRQNNLRYFICGGTLLGAVREGGFIPWDDDIDILMPRPDYEKLATEVNLPNAYKVALSPALYAKIYNESVRITYGNEAMDSECSCLNMDIFIADGTPNNLVFRNRHIGRCLYSFLLVKFKKIAFIQDTEKIKNRVDRPKAEKLLIKFGGLGNALLKNKTEEELAASFHERTKKYDYESSDVVGTYSGRHRFKEFFPRESWGDGSEIVFEGKSFKTFNNPKLYLEQIYGADYMTPPEESRREKHGDLQVVSVGDD